MARRCTGVDGGLDLVGPGLLRNLGRANSLLMVTRSWPGRASLCRRPAGRVVHRRYRRARCPGRPHSVDGGHRIAPAYLRMLTARAMTRPTVISETADWVIIVIFAHRENGKVSVGLNAVAFVKLKYR